MPGIMRELCETNRDRLIDVVPQAIPWRSLHGATDRVGDDDGLAEIRIELARKRAVWKIALRAMKRIKNTINAVMLKALGVEPFRARFGARAAAGSRRAAP